MKLSLLVLAQALVAVALPTPANDVLAEIEAREASPIAEADPIYYIKRVGYTDTLESREAEAEADPIFYIKRAGYSPEKREAEAEADPIFYIKRAGYSPEKREAEAEADPIFYIKRTGYSP